MSVRSLLLCYLVVLISCAPLRVLSQSPSRSQSVEVADRYLQNQTVTYDEAVQFYRALAEENPNAGLYAVPPGSDLGKPIYFFLIGSDSQQGLTFEEATQNIAASEKPVLLINNAIHPGESCGVDASINLAQDLLSGKSELAKMQEKVQIAIIPQYNIGGVHNRGCCTRSNQNGPETQGFRGNARNLDLNRDFIKMDSKNAFTFARIYHALQPDLFVDTHTTNGSDHQYTMTLIATQKDKIHPLMGRFLDEEMLPALYRSMEQKGDPMTPYVYSMEGTPDRGIRAFIDHPRYSSGYVSLFNTLGFISEAHVFKPYMQRVESTYRLLESMVTFAAERGKEVRRLRKQANEQLQTQSRFSFGWQLDTTRRREITFRGYEPYPDTADWLGGQILTKYDRSRPFEQPIPYYNSYHSQFSVEKPSAFIIPQAWRAVIERLKANGVEMEQLPADTTLTVTASYLTDFDTSSRPYEGHYPHRSVEIREERQSIPFYRGDFLIPMDQPANHYLMEVLEPRAVDSFFSWNFFDEVLMRKEYFSPYVFAERAEAILEENPDLKREFEAKQATDSSFAASAYAQLDFIYRNSRFYEKSHRRYPVYKR